MAFEPWSLRPDYSAIQLFYNFTCQCSSIWKKKLEANGNRTLVFSKRHTFTNCSTAAAVSMSSITIFIQISRGLVRRKKEMRNKDSNSGRGDKTREPCQCARTSFVKPMGNKTIIYIFLLIWSCNEEQMCDSYFSF